jgi:GGDEF domain-containing protein
VVAKDITFDEVEILAERIRKNVELSCSTMAFPITVSIGISRFPVDGCDVHSIISNAEIANKSAKALGKNRSCFYVRG